tara:strand:- start:309 stop:788 length:480 start_codon:yes stop_codon:yes gene_type:complete
MKKIKLFTGIYLIKKKFKNNQTYYFLKTPKISLVIPIIKDKFLLVSQYRIPINKKTYEFPGGLIDKGQTSKKTAINELYEETGFKSLISPKKFLTIYPDTGRLNCKYECFFTNKIKKFKKPEKGINIHFFSKKKILNLIKNGKFTHSCHVAAFYNYILR